MGLHQIKKLLDSKGNNKVKTSYRMVDTPCYLFIDKEFISRIYKELQKLNTKRTNNPTYKKANKLHRHLSKKYKWPINT
jgi:hypothetical protein